MLSLAMAGLILASPSHVCANHSYLPEFEVTNAAPLEDYFVRPSQSRASDPKEPNLTNLRQLTFGGQNAEAYWSKDGKRLIYQASLDDKRYPDEQVFAMNADGSGKRLVSTGLGRCTCAYYSPDGKWLYFSSTHVGQPGPQPPIDMSKGYVWMINPHYALYRLPAKQLLNRMPADVSPNPKPEAVISIPGTYVAETTIAPNGKFMVWTTVVDGDLEIYRSDLNGNNRVRLTNSVGYDGGPFVSWDSKYIVFRRDTFTDGDPRAVEYKALLKENMIRPSRLEIWIMNADGTNKRQVTKLGSATFAPFLHPDGKRIIFSSNTGDPRGREFDIYMINVDGTGLRRITHTPEFDGFPMFTRDGKKLVFASNRFGEKRGETNIFVADWKE